MDHRQLLAEALDHAREQDRLARDHALAEATDLVEPAGLDAQPRAVRQVLLDPHRGRVATAEVPAAKAADDPGDDHGSTLFDLVQPGGLAAILVAERQQVGEVLERRQPARGQLLGASFADAGQLLDAGLTQRGGSGQLLADARLEADRGRWTRLGFGLRSGLGLGRGWGRELALAGRPATLGLRRRGLDLGGHGLRRRSRSGHRRGSGRRRLRQRATESAPEVLLLRLGCRPSLIGASARDHHADPQAMRDDPAAVLLAALLEAIEPESEVLELALRSADAQREQGVAGLAQRSTQPRRIDPDEAILRGPTQGLAKSFERIHRH